MKVISIQSLLGRIGSTWYGLDGVGIAMKSTDSGTSWAYAVTEWQQANKANLVLPSEVLSGEFYVNGVHHILSDEGIHYGASSSLNCRTSWDCACR